MRRSQRRNNLQICRRRDSNTSGSDLWSNTLPLDHGGAPPPHVYQIRSDVAADDIRCDPISSDICVLLADGEVTEPRSSDSGIRQGPLCSD
ncbi:hypothetical protein LSH36_340g00011 [Paralvinella palmiformis]|uniref:Uncharacterized protein n=1 Tax=Paralvinella palmiformis TaxID=53620 RepID=A0AAD9N1K0_9ANNE|nr:hypothetical protein LSH36_340g00011 [Paralvinella palmiformis]